MLNESNTPDVINYFLEPGFILVTKQPTFISAVLGSCVAVCIYDRKQMMGGMNHFQLPFSGEKQKTTALYGNVATTALIAMMLNERSRLKNLEAQIYGGAYNPAISPRDIGRENIAVAKKVLVRKHVRIVSEDVGGQKGRKIVFSTGTNEIGVFKVDKLRKGDWYPYEPDR